MQDLDKNYLAEKARLANLTDVKGGKVYMAHYGQCEYNCLEELILELKYKRGDNTWVGLHLNEIVQYNIRFRDCLRAKGIEHVIVMLIEECPSLISEEKEFNELRRWWYERMHNHIADYDIQCYPIDHKLTLCGCEFEGLRDIECQVELSANDRLDWNEELVYPRKEFKANPHGLHVGKLWQCYPVFDIYDSYDNRTYDNFIIRKHPISAEDLRLLNHVGYGLNACRIHEHIPADLLPVVYYEGTPQYILVATEKMP